MSVVQTYYCDIKDCGLVTKFGSKKVFMCTSSNAESDANYREHPVNVELHLCNYHYLYYMENLPFVIDSPVRDRIIQTREQLSEESKEL